MFSLFVDFCVIVGFANCFVSFQLTSSLFYFNSVFLVLFKNLYLTGNSINFSFYKSIHIFFQSALSVSYSHIIIQHFSIFFYGILRDFSRAISVNSDWYSIFLQKFQFFFSSAFFRDLSFLGVVYHQRRM